MIAVLDILAIMPNAGARASLFQPYLQAGAYEFYINSPLRAAAFLGEIALESDELHYTREVWGPSETQLRYEGRADLGNTEPGDGKLFMGRGLIQTTGRANYRAVSVAKYGDERLLEDPTWLETPDGASWSACWYWQKHGLNALADTKDYATITKRINGRFRDLSTNDQRRYGYYQSASARFGLTDSENVA
jgi:putative chitinase